MIDHTGVIVKDIQASKKWYEKSLSPIGYAKLMEFSKEITHTTAVVGFGSVSTQKPNFWLSQATDTKPVNHPGIHVAFSATNRQQVDDFYATAIKAGGTDNGAPGMRPHYHPNYYGAFVYDLDGHNIEVVCHIC